MAHEIESFLYVGKETWHGLGTHLEYAPTIKEAIEKSGMQWRVNSVPLYAKGPNGELIECPENKANVRDSDNSVLGIVGKNYQILQNCEAFDWFQPFIDSNLATIETCGSLRQGKRVFVLAKLKSSPVEIIKGDVVDKYILLSNSHDGTLAVRVGFTATRVVCANTLAVAHNSGQSQLIRLKHTSQLKLNLKAIQDIMNVVNKSFDATSEQYKFLASRDINKDDLTKYIKQVFDLKEVEQRESRIISAIMPLVESGKGTEIAGVRGTYWGAYNAVTEYLTHSRGDDADIRLDSNYFGQNKTLNQSALNIALSMAKAA